MPFDFIRLVSPLPTSAARAYAAWLDSNEHSLMTGGKATIDPTVGGFHSAWDGYIGGEILELEENKRIVLSWRTSEFPPDHAHSRLELRFRDVAGGGCEVAIVHSEIPEGQGVRYEAGWHDHYFTPMTRYFRGSEAPPAPETPAAAKKPAKAKTAAKGAKAKAKPKATAKTAKKKAAKPARRPAAKKAKTSKKSGTSKGKRATAALRERAKPAAKPAKRAGRAKKR
jgi:uncharacterized protein YndB with AHSA1/START domain